MNKRNALNDNDIKTFLLSQGMTEEEIEQTLNYGCTYGELYETANRNLKENGSIYNTQKFKALPASDFGESKIDFVWKPYIPKGEYTVLMADGGTGKTFFCCGVASALSKGDVLPAETEPKEPRTTLFISAEDRGEDLKSRLVKSGADLGKIYILDCSASAGLDFSGNYEEFAELIKTHSPELVIVDPWHAFVGVTTDVNRVNVVRPVFQKLANLAKECGCGMILVSHVNKRAQTENINHGATGSTDLVNASRSALNIIFDDSEENTRILVHTKSNHAKIGQSVKFSVQNGGCEWKGFSNITKQTLEESARRKKTPQQLAVNKQFEEDINRTLIEAVREHAENGKTVNISYDQMKDEHGEDIFGELAPKKALDNVTSELLEKHCIKINTGKTVRYKGRTRNGFTTYKVNNVKNTIDDLDF